MVSQLLGLFLCRIPEIKKVDFLLWFWVVRELLKGSCGPISAAELTWKENGKLNKVKMIHPAASVSWMIACKMQINVGLCVIKQSYGFQLGMNAAMGWVVLLMRYFWSLICLIDYLSPRDEND